MSKSQFVVKQDENFALSNEILVIIENFLTCAWVEASEEPRNLDIEVGISPTHFEHQLLMHSQERLKIVIWNPNEPQFDSN